MTWRPYVIDRAGSVLSGDTIALMPEGVNADNFKWHKVEDIRRPPSLTGKPPMITLILEGQDKPLDLFTSAKIAIAKTNA
jgi:hypothetical protein